MVNEHAAVPGKAAAFLTSADQALANLFKNNKVAAHIKERRYFIFYLFAIALISYAYALFSFSLSIDEEQFAFYVAAAPGWAMQGRWGMYLLNSLFFPVSMPPFMPLFVALVFSALSFLVIVAILSIKESKAAFAAAPLFLACPTLFYMYSFNTMNYGIGIGFFLAATAFLVFVTGKEKRGHQTVFVLLSAFSIAIYQAFLIWLAVLFCFYLLSRIIRNEAKEPDSYRREGMRFFLLLIAALALYGVVDSGAIIFSGGERDPYLSSNYFHLKWKLRFFTAAFKAAGSSLRGYYSGGGHIYGVPLPAVGCLFLFSFSVVGLLVLKRSRNGLAALGGFVLLLGAVILPFALVFISGAEMPVRTALAVPLVFSALVLLAWSSRVFIVRTLLVAGCIVCSFQFMVLNNRLALTEDLTWRADRELILRIQTVIDRMAVPGSGDSQVLEFVGVHKWRRSPLFLWHQTVGKSCFEWGGGMNFRILQVMKAMGLYHRPASLKARRQVMEEAEKMPSWPADGSVKRLRRLIVVKFGPYSREQLSQLCSGDDAPSVSVCGHGGE